MTAINLSEFPKPDVVKQLSFDAIFTELVQSLIALDPALEQVLALESEPLTKMLAVVAYRELHLRQYVNDSAHAVMLAYAQDADLDNLGALFNVRRLLITPADPDAVPPVAAKYECNEELRNRIQLSLDGLSVAGPARAYIYHTLSADARVLDATADAPQFSISSVDPEIASQLPNRSLVLQVDYDAGLASPAPGDVVITVLSRNGDGSAEPDLLQSVETVLRNEEIRPLTDNPHIRGAEIINYSVQARIWTFSGPDSALIIQTAQANLADYVQKNHRLGRSITLSGIYSALHIGGVSRVELLQPTADLDCSPSQAAFCTASDITHAGTAS